MADHGESNSSVADSAKKGKTPRKTPGSGSNRRSGDVEAQLKRLEDKISRRDCKVELLKSQLAQVKKREVMLVQEVQRTRELAADSAAQTSSQFMKMKSSLAATHERERLLREQLDSIRSQAPSTCASSIAPSPDRLGGYSPLVPPQTDLKIRRLEDQLADEKLRREMAEEKLASHHVASQPPSPTVVAPDVPSKVEFLADMKERGVSETMLPVLEQHATDPIDHNAMIVTLAGLLNDSSNASLPYPQHNHNNSAIVDNTDQPDRKPEVTPTTQPEPTPPTHLEAAPSQAEDINEHMNEELAEAQQSERQDEPVIVGHTEQATSNDAEADATTQGVQAETAEGLLVEVSAEAPLEEVPVEQPDYRAYYHGEWMRTFDYSNEPYMPYFCNMTTQAVTWEQPPEFDWNQAMLYEPQYEEPVMVQGGGEGQEQGQGEEIVEGVEPSQPETTADENEAPAHPEYPEYPEPETEVQREPEAPEPQEHEPEPQPEHVEPEPVPEPEPQLEHVGTEPVPEPASEPVPEPVPEPEPVAPLQQQEEEPQSPMSPSHVEPPVDEDMWPTLPGRLAEVRNEIEQLLPEGTTADAFLGSYKTQYEKLTKGEKGAPENDKEAPPEGSVEPEDIPVFSQNFLSGQSTEMGLKFTFEQ